MSQDLSHLITWPEAQGATRVLDAISRLEQHLANLQAQKGTSLSGNNPLAAQAEISRLKLENQRLGQRQSRALDKLDALLEAIQSLPDDAAPEVLETISTATINPTPTNSTEKAA